MSLFAGYRIEVVFSSLISNPNSKVKRKMNIEACRIVVRAEDQRVKGKVDKVDVEAISILLSSF